MQIKYTVNLFILISLLFVCLLFSGMNVSALANSAAPIKPDDSSGIVFRKHEYVQIQSEVLDITINDDLTANITATYIMKNSSSESLSIETMFLTPVEYGENKNISVRKSGQELDFDQEFYSTYSYSDNKAQSIDDWESILADARAAESEPPSYQYVAAIVYYVDFAPNEELELSVSYVYQMGTSGYRRTAKLLYYLTPAKYWNDFADIEINLTLGENYKRLKSSSLKFDKIDSKHYMFYSDSLPNSELKIEVSDGSFASLCGCGTIKIDEFTAIGLFVISLSAALILFTKRKHPCPTP